MQPGSQRVRHPERARLACEDQEGCLKRILGVMMVVKHASADAQYHRTVSPDQGRECGFSGRSTPRHESIDELPIGQPGDSSDVESKIDVPKDRAVLPGHRQFNLLEPSRTHYSVMSRRGPIVPNFWDFQLNQPY